MTQPNVPVWLAPSQVGMLSNKRGADTGADSIQFQARYSNPRQSADLAGSIRVVANRIGNLSGPTSPQLAWDSGWAGSPTVTPLPNAAGLFPASTTCQVNGRVYVLLNNPAGPLLYQHSVVSAPVLTGGGVGTWRSEARFSSFPNTANSSPSASMTYAAGRLYVLDANFIYYATVNSDGTLSAWTNDAAHMPANTGGQLIGGQMAATYTVPNQGFLICVGTTMSSGGAAVTTVQNCPLNADGSLQGFVGTTALPAARRGFGYYFDTKNGFLLIAGGEDATPTVQATIYTAAVSLTAGTPGAVGAWSTQTNALPTARSRAAIVVTNQDSTQYVFVIGGTTTTAETGAITEVRSATLSNTVAVGQVGAWSAALAPALPAALSSLGAFITPLVNGQEGSIVTIGGRTAVPLNNVTTYSVNQTGGGALTGAWTSGVATGLTAGNLGTGGVLTNNQDGSQDCTFLYGGFGSAVLIAGFTDGDLVQFDVYFTDVQNSDASQVSSTIVKVGQPPTLSSVLPGAAITNGQPTASFAFGSGVGGGPEDSWQVTVKDPQGAMVFDSGIRRDHNNSVLINPAPLLKTGIAYTFTWQAWSNDVVFNGATNTATSTLAVTPTLTTPAVPTNVSAAADNPNGRVNASWFNPSPPATSGNRIYYRRSGQMAWRLLADLLGPTTSQQLMDMLCLAVGYDVAVSQLDRAVNAFVESAHSSPLSDDFETAGTTGTLWHSLGTEAGTDNSIAYWTTPFGPYATVTYASHVATAPVLAAAIGGHADWSDGSAAVRFTFTTNSRPGVLLHADAAGANWVEAFVDGTNLRLWKKSGGGIVAGVGSTAAALSNATAYWLRLQATGTTYTATVFADTGGVTGAQIATLTASITDPTVQSGRMGIKNGGDGEGQSAGCTFGGAFANVCNFTGPIPAIAGVNWSPVVTAGEPAFCWSKVSPYAGTYSLSIFNAIAGGQGAWQMTPLTYQTWSYTLAGQLRGSGTPTKFQLQTADTLIQSTQPAADNAWHLVTGAGSPAANSVPQCVAQGQGTYYFDNVTMLQSGGYNATIDPSAYGCFLHLAGSGQSYKVSPSLKGQPVFPSILDSSITTQYGQLAPSGRYGPLNYSQIEVQLLLTSYAMLQALAALMLQAQRTGGTIIYRDGFGARFTGVLDPAQGPVNYKQPVFRLVNLKLHQVADTLTPNVGQGSAGAIPALVFGSVPALDQAELLV